MINKSTDTLCAVLNEKHDEGVENTLLTEMVKKGIFVDIIFGDRER